MTRRTRGIVAWGLVALCVALIATALVIETLVGSFELAGVAFGAGMLVSPVVGALIVTRTPNRIGWLLLAVGLGGVPAIGLGSVAELHAQVPGHVWIAWVANWIWPFAFASLILVLQLFPDGRPLSRRWRWVIWLTVLAALSLVVGGAFDPGQIGDYPRFTNPVGIEALRGTPLGGEENMGWGLLIVAVLGSAASLAVRYRRSRAEARQQLKWLAYAGGLFAAGWMAIVLTWDSPGLALLGEVLFGIGALSVPVAVGIAILRYRLYDIDVVINKTLVYGSLAAFITGVYVAIVVGIGHAIGTGDEPNLGLSILATAVVALAFQPVRARVQHLANRLVYGRRATPYEVLTEFAGRVGGSYAVDDVLPRMARAIAEGTGAERAEVLLGAGQGLHPAAVWPLDAAPGSPDVVVPVFHRGEALGALSVSKPRGERLTPAEEKLVQDLAAQAGLVLRNVRLLEELRASRERLVKAQDAERRRIERDIHDGAQQQLVALAVKLRLAESLVAKDPAKAAELLAGIKAETTEALETLRDLARGIYPPLLADQGLPAALQAQVRKVPLPVEVEADGVGRYPQEVEAAVYFCCLEALQNAAKYSGASRVAVRLGTTESDLRFEVEDDGAGFDPERTPRGTGLQNMADRLEALGGSLSVRSAPGEGTTVAGRLRAPDGSPLVATARPAAPAPL